MILVMFRQEEWRSHDHRSCDNLWPVDCIQANKISHGGIWCNDRFLKVLAGVAEGAETRVQGCQHEGYAKELWTEKLHHVFALEARVLCYHLAYAWLRQGLHGVTAGLSRVPQGFAFKHLGRTEPGCDNRLRHKSQGMIPLGLQERRLKGHTKGRLSCIEQEGWWFKKTKLESLGLRTRVYIQVMRALKLLPKVREP